MYDDNVTIDQLLAKMNKILEIKDGEISRPQIKELNQFRNTWFYHNWRQRFIALGHVGAIAIPNTTFEQWLVWFAEFASTFVNDYNQFKDLVLQAIEEINKHLEIIDLEIEDIYNRLDKIDAEITEINKHLTIIDNEITDIYSRLDKIDGEITNINNHLTNIDNEITDIENEIKALNGSFTALKRGTDFDVTFYNGWYEGVANEVVHMGVAETNEQWIFHLGMSDSGDQRFLNDNLSATKFKHAASIDDVPESRVLLITLKGDYADAIKGRLVTTTNDNNIINVHPSSARASWSISYGLYKVTDLGGFMCTLTSISDGYNAQWDRYSETLQCVGANIGVTFTIRKVGQNK